METRPKDVLDYWFDEPAATPAELAKKMKRWFRGGPSFDAEIVQRFGADVERAVAGGLEEWLAEPKGWLALVILLDQLTRNVFRGDAKTYAGDARAQKLAREALDGGKHAALSIEERNFALMPFVHAEDLALQERAVVEIAKLVADAPEELRPIFAMGVEQSRKYRDIIARFGRFPHRNQIFGRTTTAAEMEFLREFAGHEAPSGAAELDEKYGL